MVRTSGGICLVMGLRRAARYLVSTASMICWMKVRSSRRVSKYIYFVKGCVSSTLAIWAAVPDGFGMRTPKFDGRVNGSVGAMRRYSAGVRIVPR